MSGCVVAGWAATNGHHGEELATRRVRLDEQPAEYRLEGHGWKRMDGWVGRPAVFAAGLGIAAMTTTVERLMTPFPLRTHGLVFVFEPCRPSGSRSQY